MAECSILFEVLLIEIQEEIHHFAGWEGGGLRGTKIVNINFVNKRVFPFVWNHLKTKKASVAIFVVRASGQA